MSGTIELWTFQDIVEHLLDVFNEDRSGRPLRMARRAVREGLRELMADTRWTYFDSRRTILTEASQTSSTITFDYTGGTYERELTLASGTWPDNARYFRIILDGVHYPIDTRESDTVLTLPANQNPGADIAAGTGYTLYRSSYPLPVDFVEMGRLFDVDNEVEIGFVLSDTQHTNSIFFYETPDTPWQAAIRNEGEYLNSLSLVFGPPPSTAKTYDFMYQRAPRPLVTELVNTGTATLTAGQLTVTMSDGVLDSSHVGSIIRFGTAAAAPTNVFGGIADTDNYFSDERVILAVNSTTECEVDATVSSTLTTVNYTISDPVDIETVSMLTAYQRLCELAYTRLNKRDQKMLQEREQAALFAIRTARERDRRALVTRGIVPYDRFARVTPTDEA